MYIENLQLDRQVSLLCLLGGHQMESADNTRYLTTKESEKDEIYMI